MKNKDLMMQHSEEIKQNQPQHTPGPWFAWPCCDENNQMPRFAEVLQDPRPAGGFFYDTQPLICRAFYGKTDDERLANARLIAAAPELLEALKTIAADSRLVRLHTNHQQMIRTAIAKATGQE